MTWDLTSYFPQFDGPEMRQFKEALRSDVAALREQAAALSPLTEESADAWEQVLARNEDLSRRHVPLEFIYQLPGVFGRPQRSLSQRGSWAGATARRVGQGENRTAACV